MSLPPPRLPLWAFSTILALTALAGPASATTSRAGADSAMRLPIATSDVEVGPAGQVRVALTSFSTRSRATIRRLDGKAADDAPVTILRPSTRRSQLRPSFTPDGFVVTYQTKDSTTVWPLHVVSVDAKRRVRRPQRLTRTGYSSSSAGRAQVGPTGAVALVFSEHKGPGRDTHRLTFRPAGSRTFRKPITIGKATRLQPYGPSAWVLLGPDGGGVVITRPIDSSIHRPFLQRLSPSGALGPKIPIVAAMADYADVVAAFGPTGTLVVAVNSAGLRDAGSAGTELLTTTLPAGASRTTPILRTDVGAHSARFNLSVVVGARDHTTLMISSDHDTDDLGGPESDVVAQRIYEGTGADLKLTERLTAWAPSGGTLALGPDGALTAAWAEDDENEFSIGAKPIVAGIYGTRRPPGGAFAPPRLLSTQSELGDDECCVLTPLRDGRVAIQYDRYVGENDYATGYVLLTTP